MIEIASSHNIRAYGLGSRKRRLGGDHSGAGMSAAKPAVLLKEATMQMTHCDRLGELQEDISLLRIQLRRAETVDEAARLESALANLEKELRELQTVTAR